MYSLDTSRWCLSPLCVLHFRLNPFLHAFAVASSDSVVRFGGCITLAVWRTYRLLGSCSLLFISFLNLAFLGQDSSFSRWAHILFSCMHGLLGHCSYYVIPPCLPRLYPSFTSCFVVGLWLVHFLVNFLFQASHAHFSLLYLSQTLLANIPVVPTHFIASFFGLPQTIYYLFASFTFMIFLLNPLGFLDPITTSLLFNTTWAYWFLGQPIEFTTHFLGFLGSFTPSLPLTIPMSLLLHSLNFLGPLTISLSLFIIVAMLAINSTIPAC